MRSARALAAAAVVSACSSPAKPPTAPTNATTKPAVAESGPIGTANPITIEATDPDGKWVVACQARRDTNGDGKVGVNLGMHGDTFGDAMTPYLILGSGSGIALDAFIDQTSDGAWIAAIADGKLVVISGHTSDQPITLADADLRDDDYPTLGSRIAGFAGDRRIVFMRHRDTGDVAVMRDLTTGQENEVAVPGNLWRLEPDAGGTWVRAITVRRDTDKSGSFEWPTQHTSLSARGCRGPIGSYGTYGASGDEPDLVWIGFDGTGLVDDASVVSVAGTALVKVGKDRSLMIGDQVALPAGCDPTVRATAADPPRVLAGCGPGTNDKVRLQLAAPGATPRDLGVDVEKTDSVMRLAPGDRLACLDGTVCVDVESGKTIARSVVYADGDRVLVRRDDDRFAVLDAAGDETVLAKIDGYPMAAAGPIVAIGSTVIDLAGARIIGAVEGEVFAVDRDGRALVAAGTADDTPGPDLPAGPVRWIIPK